MDIANGIIEKQYENITEDQDTIEAIKDFQDRYTEKVKLPHEVMLEDWLLLVRIFFLANSDLIQDNPSAVQGFEQLLLDAIYNDGMVQDILDWQPFFGQNYSEQEITLTTVLIQLISECLTPYIPLALDNLKNHEFLYYYTNKYTLLILTATPLMSQICSDI